MITIVSGQKEVNLCDSAIQYLCMGLSVIPTRGKQPALRSWREYQQRLPTEGEWEFWCFGDFNGIGLVLDRATWERWPHLWVLDVEAHYRPQAEARLGDILSRTAVAESIRGGLHVYFLSPRPVRSTRFAWGDILGKGRIVNLPPSGWGGRVYRWLRPPEGPENLLRLLPEDLNLPGLHPPATEGREYEPILQRRYIPEGQRNNTLTSLAGVLRQGMGIPRDQARDFLLWANRKFCVPPLPDEEVEGIVRSVYRYPYRPTRLDPKTRAVLEGLLREAGIRTACDTPPILTFEGPSSTTLKPCVWLGDVPLFPGELVVIDGEPGSGKTTLVLRALPEDALLIETDFGPEVFGALRAALGMTTRVHFMNPSTPAHVVECLNQVRGQASSLICLDTLQGITGVPEELDGLVATLYRYAQETGVPVVVVSHTNRRQDVPPLHRIQGTLRLAQQATLVIEIRGWGKRPREARVLKDRYGILRDIPERWPIPGPGPHRPSDPGGKRGSSPVPEQSAPPKPKPAPSQGLRKILALLQTRGPMSANDIVRELKNVSLSTVKRILRSPEAEPHIRIVRHGGRGGRGRRTLYALKTDHAYSNEGLQEMNPKEAASEQEWSVSGQFIAYGEADSRGRNSETPETGHAGREQFISYGEAAPRDFSTNWSHIGIYTRDPKKRGRYKGSGGVSQGENETRPEPVSGSGTTAHVDGAVEPQNGSTEDIHARPPEPADIPSAHVGPEPTLTQETESACPPNRRTVSDACPPENADDFPIWAIWTIEMPNTRKGGACPFHDCPYHKPLTPKDPWSWLL